MLEKIIYKKGIGEILLKKNKSSKRFSIKLKPFEGIVVSLPYYADFSDAEDIIAQKEAWILKNLRKIEEIEEKKTVFDEYSTFQTRMHILKILKSERKDAYIKIKNGLIMVVLPNHLHIRDEFCQNTVRKAIVETYRLEAKEIIPPRIEYFSKKHNLPYNKLTIKDIKSRWGSCSGKNNINLSLYLMQLPDELIDYVILHELTHTLEKNHGKGFWNLMNKLTNGQAKKLDKMVNNYSTRYF